MITAPPRLPLRDLAATVRDTAVTPLARAGQFAWLAIVVPDAGLLVWDAMAALAPGCPGGCLTTRYETFTKQSWSQAPSRPTLTPPESADRKRHPHDADRDGVRAEHSEQKQQETGRERRRVREIYIGTLYVCAGAFAATELLAS